MKAVALGHPAYMLDLGGLRPLLRKAVPTRSVKGREFGGWEQVWNKPIFLSDKTQLWLWGLQGQARFFT